MKGYHSTRTFAAFRSRDFRFQWPADLLTSWAFEMEMLLLAPVTLYLRNTNGKLESAASSGCDVISVDETLPLAEARRRLTSGVGLQGNLDPDNLSMPADHIRSKVHRMIADAGSTGYIVNVGRGLVPGTPVEGVEAFVKAVREWAA